jgi:hypothetical protein
MTEPTADDKMAAAHALSRAIRQFKITPPSPHSLGALTYMVDECAIEIARARAGLPSEPGDPDLMALFFGWSNRP